MEIEDLNSMAERSTKIYEKKLELGNNRSLALILIFYLLKLRTFSYIHYKFAVQ